MRSISYSNVMRCVLLCESRLNRLYCLLIIAGIVFGLLPRIHADETPTSKPITVTGTLETGVFAIGGETTGTVLKSNGRTYELELGDDEALRSAAEKLNGKEVVVVGPLKKVTGVEVRERWIITVKTLTENKTDSQPVGEANSNYEAQFRRNDTVVQFREFADVNPILCLQGSVHQDSPAKSSGNVDRVMISIRSEFGIDSGVVKRMEETWPQQVLLQLHLRGLEKLQVSNGADILEYSVSSGESHEVRSIRRKVDDSEELTLAPGDPWHSDMFRLTMGKENGTRVVSIFLALLPELFLADNPESITIEFVDFYR